MCSCEFCETFKNTFFTEHFQTNIPVPTLSLCLSLCLCLSVSLSLSLSLSLGRIFRSSYRKLVWVGFEPTTTEFRSDVLTDWAIRPWVQLTLRANFVQLLQFHLFVQCSRFISVFAFVSRQITCARLRLKQKRIQSECGKIRTRNNSVFGHFSRSDHVKHYY